LNPEPAD